MGVLFRFSSRVVAIIMLAGCVTQPAPGAQDDSGRQATTESQVYGAPSTPVIVMTDPGATVTLRVFAKPSCEHWHMKQFVSVTIYDAHGKVDERIVKVVTGSTRVDVPLDLEGEPPFLVAGDRMVCAGFNESLLIGAEGVAIQRLDEEKYSALRWWKRENVTVRVPAGFLEAEGYWDPADEVWNFRQVWFDPWIADRPNPDGAQYGTIEMIGPDGDMVKRDRFTPFEWEEKMATFQKMPGGYLIRVTLDSPWPTDSNWTYSLTTFRFDEAVCDLGFKWKPLCDVE